MAACEWRPEIVASHSLNVLASLAPAVPTTLARQAEDRDPEAPPSRPRPAASVVLCRDGAAGLETYLLHRHARMAFAASVAVFPGGGLEPGDRASADPLLACGLRETREETGVELAGEGVVRWAHWITPVIQPLRYDTVFFLAALPPGQIAEDLSTETESAGWMTPAAAVADHAAGRLALMPPTLSILVELSDVPTVAQALALGRDRVVETVLPEVVRDGDGWVYRYPRPQTGVRR
jgi:8-oxo-dGTP pyrophosphatase MutT (NUDIX family)